VLRTLLLSIGAGRLKCTNRASSAAGLTPPRTSCCCAGSSGMHAIGSFVSAGGMDLYNALTDAKRVKAFTQSDASISAEPGGAFAMFGGSIEGKQVELVPGKRIVQDWRFNTWPEGHYSKVRCLIFRAACTRTSCQAEAAHAPRPAASAPRLQDSARRSSASPECCSSRSDRATWLQVVIDIDESEPGLTKLTLTQTGIPEEDRYGNHDVVGTTENGWKNLIFYKIRAVFGYGL
jgi:activator of HSP90 ATPase